MSATAADLQAKAELIRKGAFGQNNDRKAINPRFAMYGALGGFLYALATGKSKLTFSIIGCLGGLGLGYVLAYSKSNPIAPKGIEATKNIKQTVSAVDDEDFSVQGIDE